MLLATALTASTIAVPVGLGAAVATTALASIGGAAVTNATVLTMKWVNAKIAAGVIASSVIVGTGAYFVQQSKVAQSPSTPAAATPAGSNSGRPVRPLANSIGGILKTSDGQPLPGAEVYLSTASIPVPVYAAPSPQVPSTRTGLDGGFSFPDDAANRAVIVLSDKGYGQATVSELAARPELTLQPWARIEGTLHRGNTALANETIHLSRSRFGSKLQEQAFRTVHDTTTKTDADGKPLKLADCEGKYILLNFWRTDRPETVEELEYLKSAQTTWGKDKRFALIGLNFDLDLPTVRKFVANHAITWTQCFLGKLSDIPARYRLRGPTTILIGPYGQILRRELVGPDITVALRDALGPK